MTGPSERDKRDNDLMRKLLPPQGPPPSMAGPSSPGGGSEDVRTRESFRNPMTDIGDIIVGTDYGAAVAVPIGDEDQVLTVTDLGSGVLVPRWQDATGGGGGGLTIQLATVEIADNVDTLDFEGDQFFVVDNGGGNVGIAIDGDYAFEAVAAILTSDDMSVTITPDSGDNTVDLSVAGGSALAVYEGGVSFEDPTSILDFDGTIFDLDNPSAGHVSVTLDPAGFQEMTEQAMADVLISSDASILFTWNDGANTIDLTIDPDTLEETVQDIVAAQITSTDGSVDITYDDAGDGEIDLSVVDYVIDAIDDALDDEGSRTWVNTHAFGQIIAQPTTTTVLLYGMSTGTSAGTTSSADDTAGAWIQCTQTTTASFSGRSNMGISYFPDWGLTWVSRNKLYSTITNQRFWTGMFSGTLANATDNDLPPSSSMAAFRHSTNASDTNFQCVSSDGSGNYEVTDSGVAAVAGADHKFRIHFGTTTARFYIDDLLVAVHSTRVPASGANMGWLTGVKNLVGGGSARGLLWGYLSLSRRN